MSSKAEKELLREISYLESLIHSHKKHGTQQSKPTGSSSAHKWKNSLRSPTGPRAQRQQVPSSVRPTQPCSFQYSASRMRTRHTNLVYRPASDRVVTSATAATHFSCETQSQPQRKPLPQEATRPSRSQPPASASVQPSLLTHSISPHKPRPPHMEGGAAGSVSAEPGASAAPSIVTLTQSLPTSSGGRTRKGSGSTRKRKRSSSRAGSSLPSTKKQKSPAIKVGKYVWPSRNITSKYMYKHRQLLSPRHQLPKRSQLRWKRRSLEATEGASVSGSVAAESGRRQQRKQPRAPLSTPRKNTKYRWRKNSSSSSKVSKRDSECHKPPQSPLIAHSRFKLTRASLMPKHVSDPHFRSPARFTQRRISYLRRHSTPNSLAKKRHERVFESKNRIWVSSSSQSSLSAPCEEGTGDSVSGATAREKLHGRERKTKHGNRQWLATGAKRLGRPSPVVKRRRSQTGGEKEARTHEVSLRGHRFVVDGSRRRLKRLPSVSAPVALLRSASVSDSDRGSSAQRLLASQAVRRSKAYVWHSKRKSLHIHSTQYCTFFNRFGKCNRGDACPFVHDPDRVAICTKFLRGVCDKTDGSCPFSHKVSKEKVPVCSFFLRGVCSKEDCPYSHVSVGREAELCSDFIRGYCSQGEKCTKQHVLECPEFSHSGSCPRGKACPLRHRKRARRRQSEERVRKKVVERVKEPFAFKKAQRKHQLSHKSPSSSSLNDSTLITPLQLEFIPLDKDADFIAL